MLIHLFHSLFDSEFTDFIKLGWDHIIDYKAYDHLLYVMTLCALFSYQEWRKILVIITAFTIGHSMTLALSALNYLILPQKWVEVMIPLTILITALSNTFLKKNSIGVGIFDNRIKLNYLIALCFGLIHGLGFANNFRFMLGEETSIVSQLFAFNTGLELGQLTVVVVFMFSMWFFNRFFHIVHREWTLFFSGAGAGIALMLIMNVL
jgi:hypothetical protein